jgi:hypothetical protein
MTITPRHVELLKMVAKGVRYTDTRQMSLLLEARELSAGGYYWANEDNDDELYPDKDGVYHYKLSFEAQMILAANK